MPGRCGPYVCPTCGETWSKNLSVMLDGDCPACNAEYGAVEQS